MAEIDPEYIYEEEDASSEENNDQLDMSDREIELASNEIEIQNLDGTVTVARLDTAPKSEEERGAKAYIRTGEAWCLDEAAKILKQTDNDLQFMIPDIQALDRFLDQEAQFINDDAVRMTAEMNNLWPKIQDVTPKRLMMLRRGIERTVNMLEYRLLRAFIAEGCYRASLPGNSNEVKLVNEVIETAKRMMPRPESTPSIFVHNENVLIQTIRHKLTDICRAGAKFDVQLKDQSGDNISGDDLPAIWRKFADSTDIDQARAAWFEATRYHATALTQREANLLRMNEDLLELVNAIFNQPGSEERATKPHC